MNAYVSLTTHARRAPYIAEPVLSLVRQAEACDCRVCLSVAGDVVLPNEVRALADAGRIELLVEPTDLGVNMKWIPARRAHPDSPIICLDDDRIYSDELVPQLLAAHESLPDAFLCCAFRSLCIQPDGSTAPYSLSRASGHKAVLRSGAGLSAPVRLWPGTYVAEHWAGCLHPPRFGLDFFDEAVANAPHDDDTFLSVLASRSGVPCYCIPVPQPLVVRDLMRDASFPGSSAIRESALGGQRTTGWDRTAAVLRHYESDLREARRKDAGWERFGLRLLLSCDAYAKRRKTALTECERVGLSVEELRCPHLATEGLSERTCPDDHARAILAKLPTGPAGVMLAHWMAMRRFLESPHDTMLVLEDDVRFLRDTERLSAYVKSLPANFDEARFCWGGARRDARRGEPFGSARWRLVRGNIDSLYMTAAYAVSRRGAEAWMQAFDASLDDPLPCDLLVRRYGPSENVCVCNPPCAISVPSGDCATMSNNMPLVLDVLACGGRAEDYQDCGAPSLAPVGPMSESVDILYSVGPDSGHDNAELRWSLESVRRYAKNLGRVIVAGYPPSWLPDWVERFPVERDPNKCCYANLFECVMAAIDAGVVRGEFLYSSDDHFLSMPFDCRTVPFYRRQMPQIPTYEKGRGGENYRRMMAQTRDVLLREGYGIIKCNTHKMTRLRCSEANEVRRLASLAPDQARGIELTCAFQNVRARREHIAWTDSRDWKIRSFDANAIAGGQFSCGDGAFSDPRFVEYMEMTYGDCCRPAPQGGAPA